MATNVELSSAAGHSVGLNCSMSGRDAPDAMLDIRSETCPMTFVRARLALDRLSSGDILLLMLRGAEPRERVTVTVQALGHTILSQNETAFGDTLLLIRRG